MKSETFKVFIAATQRGTHRNGLVSAAYAMRIIGQGTDKYFSHERKVADVQTMYALALRESYAFIWAELDDSISANPSLEMIVSSAKIKVRFDQASEHLLKRTLNEKIKGSDNIEVWLEDVVMATHMETVFRIPSDEEEKLIIKALARRATVKLNTGFADEAA